MDGWMDGWMDGCIDGMGGCLLVGRGRREGKRFGVERDKERKRGRERGREIYLYIAWKTQLFVCLLPTKGFDASIFTHAFLVLFSCQFTLHG